MTIESKTIRNGFLAALTLSGAGLLASYLAESQSHAPVVVQTPTSYVGKGEHHIIFPAIVDKLYPELASSGLYARSKSIVGKQAGLPTEILNFTNYSFNPKAADTIYSLFAKYKDAAEVKSIEAPYAFNQEIGGSIYNVYIGATPNVQNRTVVIVPQD